jgi:hypothetical protein
MKHTKMHHEQSFKPWEGIINVLVTVGKVVCQMNFLVVDIDNYDLLLRLDFLMKIGVVVDVENGIIHVQNGLGITMEVLPLNVVNMLHKILGPKV